ncbi:MAG TPA: LacI family DNA-binding transcriptional regulator [Candidatus Omnitrophota bacterium]|nr:LacI family DNA-binding transcriptional regulator [Candidatus Omnitrophota bacterium]
MVRSRKKESERKISIEDVAKRANVSITTVSRVINNISTVSKKNRTKVEEAVVFLKYKPNVSAQRLARGTNNAVGLVIPGYPGIFHSFYAVELIRGVGHACETTQMDLVFHISNGIRPLNTNNVDGLVFADIIENRKQVEQAVALGVPCVIINNEAKDLEVNYIAVDNQKGGEIAADYLTSFGHKRIATITGNLATQAGSHRYEGFKNYLDKKKISLPKEYVYQGDYSRRSARFAAEQFLELKEPPTAIFAASDDMALEAIAVILERGLKVPGDISVIGFDDNPSCLYGPVALTTIKQPLFQMASDAVKVLHEIISGKHKRMTRNVLTPELIVRESCAAPKN